jgi:hypothetical protein
MPIPTMTPKKEIPDSSFLFHQNPDLIDPWELHEIEVRQMTNREFYYFLVVGTTGMFIVSFLIKIFII